MANSLLLMLRKNGNVTNNGQLVELNGSGKGSEGYYCNEGY